MEEMEKKKAETRKALSDFQELLDHEKLLKLSSWRDKKPQLEEEEKKDQVFDIKGKA